MSKCEEILNTNYLSRYIRGEEVDEIERVKRDVNVETVEKDIRYFYSTLFLQCKTKNHVKTENKIIKRHKKIALYNCINLYEYQESF